MSALPAQAAGVERIVLATPPGPDGAVHQVTLAAAALCGIEEIYAVGGAQAVFALAFGTETIEPVDVIAGPGNAWVQEAKRAVYGTVGIDSLAGPSELMVIAGHDTEPEWVALDLCAQAEHGDGALLVAAVEEHVLDAVARGDRAARRRASERRRARRWRSSTSPTRPTPPTSANAFAPEHLELFEEDAEPARRADHHRRLRLRRPLGRDRLRRLRRRLQPRAADRRRRPLHRPARARRLPPADLDRGDRRRRRRGARAARRRARPRRGLPRPRRVGR